jgi:thiamine pyrophosphate-dependent acetolactate synthase large subunit-like protein
LILAGRGAVLSGAAPALRRLGELTGGLLATTLRATGLFSGDPYDVGVCGTFATPVASDLITQADCVLAFGAALNHMTTYNNTLFPKAMVVHVDADEAAIGRFVDAGLAIRADARQVAEALVSELERRGHSVTGFRTPATREAIAAYRIGDGVRDQGTPDLIDPRVLMLELDRILPRGRILCADTGQHARFAIRYLRVERPENLVQASEAGSIGLGIGTGIGAAIGRPGELIVVAVGDGGMMMSLGDLETAVRLRLPMLVVVSNDEALGAEVNVLSDLGMETRLAKIPSPSFEAVAAALGARAATVRSAADLGVVAQWLRDRADTPLVLGCRVNPEVRWS